MSCQSKKEAAEDVIIEQGKSVDSLILVLTERIKSQPDNDVNFFKRAQLYRDQGKLLLAINDIEKAISLQKEIYEYHNLLGDVFFRAGNHSGAIKAYEESMRLNPYDDYAALETGKIYLYRTEPDYAIKYLNKALEIDKYNFETHSFLALYHLQKEDTNRAVSRLKTSIEINPDYFEGYVDLGYLLMLRGDKNSLWYFEHALRVEPGNVQVLYNRGKFYQDIDSTKKAIEDYNSILQQVPDHKSANYNMGYLSYLRSDFQQAISYFTKAIQKYPSYQEAYYGRGLSYKMLGNHDLARKDFEKALELEPDDKIVLKELNNLK